MKQQWQKLVLKINALSVRERVMALGGAAALIIFLGYVGVIDPAYAQQKNLLATMVMQRTQLTSIGGELQQREALARNDPEKQLLSRILKLKSDNNSMRATLRSLQQGMVAPEKMVDLLQQLVRGHGKLELVSLTTLAPRGSIDGHFDDDPEPEPEAGAAATAGPPNEGTQIMGRIQSQVSQAPAGAGPRAAPAAAGAAAPGVAAPIDTGPKTPLLYRHGVRVVLRGGYLEMVSYMEALEAMPSRVFWGRAALKADDYPAASLTLTLYTLSLDPTWIAL